eukprot:GEMP01032814.1.p1 GENE.GEMP01032814.1~~GEMP01032814.1.p1  ORF type:complete len:556 (+),score=86.48 GEMP01032814.1:201-1868(+)
MLFLPLLSAIHCAASAVDCVDLNTFACVASVVFGQCDADGLGTCKPKAGGGGGDSTTPPKDIMIVTAESKCIKEIGETLGEGYGPPTKPRLPKVGSNVVKRLRMSDWPTGNDKALRIKTPGKYILEEDIVFDFADTPRNLEPPLQWDNVIGIAIQTSGVELDLNGHTISMSTRFMSRQRFFFHVQLNNMVFHPPDAHYDGKLTIHNDIIIRNGKFGQTSHMAIQGIENSRVLIEDVTFESFEVAAISCKDCNDVTIQRCALENANLRVPLNTFFAELWSTTRWVHRFQQTIAQNRLMAPAWNMMRSAQIEEAFQGRGQTVQPNGGGLPQGSIFGIQLKRTTRKLSFAALRASIDDVTINNLKNGESTRVGLSFNGAQLVCNNANVLDFNQYFNEDGDPKNVFGQTPEIILFRTCVLTAGDTFPMPLKSYISRQQRGNIFRVNMDRSGKKLKKFYGTDSRGHEPAGAFGIRVKGWSHVTINNVKINGVDNGESGSNLGNRRSLSSHIEYFRERPEHSQGTSVSQATGHARVHRRGHKDVRVSFGDSCVRLARSNKS